MSKVCVTGCAGFIGSHLCERLLKDGHEVIGINDLSGGDLENVPLPMQAPAYFFQKDCCWAYELTWLLAGCDVVYHCAAYPHEGLSVFSPFIVTKNTYLSTVSMATAAVKAGVKRFVFLSSMARYGDNDVPFFEDDTPRPVDPYGIAKVASEKVCLCLGKAHGMEVVICVPHNVIGIRQRYVDPYRNVASIFINRMLQGQAPYIYGDGRQTRCFSAIDDCIEPLIKMGFQPGLDRQVINIGPDDYTISVLELSKLIANLCGWKGEPIFVPDRPCEVKNAWCSSDKARRLLGYETKTRLVDCLAAMVEDIKKRGPKPFMYHGASGLLRLEIKSDRTPKTWLEKLM